jgi:hypothetical protein
MRGSLGSCSKLNDFFEWFRRRLGINFDGFRGQRSLGVCRHPFKCGQLVNGENGLAMAEAGIAHVSLLEISQLIAFFHEDKYARIHGFALSRREGGVAMLSA